MAEDFSKLESLYQMLGPSDLAGSVRFSRDKSTDTGLAHKLLELLLSTDSKGVLSAPKLKTALDNYVNSATPEVQGQFNDLIRFHSTAGKLAKAPKWHHSAKDKSGKPVDEATMAGIVGPTVKISDKQSVTFILSSSPFISPTVRDAKKVEFFMNNIPTLEMSRCVPYLDVEFRFDRPYGNRLAAPSVLKFLLGAAKFDDLGPADSAMLGGRRYVDTGNREISFAGMELFTSPQTMVNPVPLSEGADGLRYVPVVNPFVPLASLESFEINVRPSVGMFTYKTARMQLKIHDRSRLGEFSDFIQPGIYPRTTVWVTYGWRHPVEPSNPMAVFINSNMLIREAYSIMNSSYKFEAAGQVTLNLELFTRGVSELKTIKIHDSPDGPASVMRQLQQLAEDVSKYRKALHIEPHEGVNKEIRPFQVLDAAEKAEFPDLKRDEIKTAIDQLNSSLRQKDSKLDQTAAANLKTALEKMYLPGPDKLDFKQRLEKSVTNVIAAKFKELKQGLDPFLPTVDKDKDKGPGATPNPIAQHVAKYNKESKTKVNDLTAQAVSFAKLFASFCVSPMLSVDSIDEVQVFFYAFNDQAGGVAGTNIGEFPIDVPVFLDQYKEHIKHKGSENITIEEFVGLVVNAQIDDPRAIAYGMRQNFEPYSTKNKEPQVSKKQEKNYETEQAKIEVKQGPFKKPAIEMYIETLAEAATRDGEPDAYSLFELALSAKDDGTVATTLGLQSKKIMRVHIYDKQLNPYKTAALLLKSENGQTFLEIPKQENAIAITERERKDGGAAVVSFMKGTGSPSAAIANDAKTGAIKLTQFSTNQQVKDAVAQTVPTIVYGTNATNVHSAELSSKMDALLSTVQMQRAGKQNTIGANGSGVGGLPLRIIPAQLSVSAAGCPLIHLAQIYFFDFSTGTTADALYILTGLTHSFAPGKFDSNLTFSFVDGYARWEGSQGVISYLTQPSPAESPDPPKKKKA